MTKISKSACNKLPAQDSKRQLEPKRNMKYKRRRNSGGETTALYFRWKRDFYKLQHNHCNSRQRKKQFTDNHTIRRRKKRPSKKKRAILINKMKSKKRMVSNRGWTKKHKVYNHKSRSATTLKSEQNTVNPKIPEGSSEEESNQSYCHRYSLSRVYRINHSILSKVLFVPVQNLGNPNVPQEKSEGT